MREVVISTDVTMQGCSAFFKSSFWAIASLLTLLAAGFSGSTSEHSAAADEKKSGAPSKERIRDLVESLVSRNRPPVLNQEFRDRAKFDKEFSWEEQQRVAKTYAAISERFEEAFDELIPFLDDERYAVTVQSPSGNYDNKRIGDLIAQMFRRQIAVYTRVSRRQVWLDDNGFPSERQKLIEWARSKKKATLAEMQLEWVTWAMEREQSIPFQDSDEESTVLKSLRDMEAQLREQRPVKVSNQLPLGPK
jgi:hypothetical protein